MSKAIGIGFGGVLLSLLAMPVYSQELNCTATPDCATLGYNKTLADCPEGAVKCPFNPSRVFCLKRGGGNNFAIKAKVTNMNIVYSDGTNANALTASKIPVGIGVVTETNTAYNHGFIVAKDQPIAATYNDAVKRCNEYVTAGTSEGDWQLMNLEEAIYINGWDPSDTATGTTQYTNLNNAMFKIPEADRLGVSMHYNYCQAGSPDNGGTYLNGAPACSNTNISGTASCSFSANQTTSYQSGYPEPIPLQTCYGNGRQYPCASFFGSKTVNGTCSSPANKTLTSDFYWTINELPGTATRPYYFQLGATNGNRAMLGAAVDKNKKALYRCVLRF